MINQSGVMSESVMLQQLLKSSKVIPVVTVHSEQDAVDIGLALQAGGLSTIEVVLRSDAALASIERLANQVPELVVGAGSIRSAAEVRSASAAGAKFLVSPGTSPSLIAAATESGLPFLPGAATPSEILGLAEQGFTVQKLFPFAALGGVHYLNAIAAVFPTLTFCPTGGIRVSDLESLLLHPHVLACGGSWLVPQRLVEKKDWSGIAALAHEVSEIIKNLS
jgi:2-dehydro-3-deoxyphosphogluconate aldolase/(4S)-4-hydroxy-2-oxoglutarate aldolase